LQEFLMRKRTIWTTALAAATLAIGLAAPPANAVPVATGSATVTSSQADQLVAQLPAWREQAATVRARLGLDDSPLREATLNAIDPTQYECSPAQPPVVTAITAGIANWTADQRLAALYVLLFDLPMTEAVYFPTPGPYTFGAHGDFTTKATHTFRDLRNFWDIKSDDIQLVPAHGRMLLDTARVTKVFTTFYGFPQTTSLNTAEFIKAQVNTATFNYGDTALFTFNAYANSTEGQPVPGIGDVPDRIVLGDGVLDGFAQVGLDDVTTQAILAHEFGHHVQFEDGLFASPLTGPEATRRTELMADAFGSYFLTHARGAAMNWKRVQEFGQTFYQVGDCGFTAVGHHGTPNQRLRTVLWAHNIADSARPQGHILPSRTFDTLFEQALPQLVAPDATN
jgi:hypothetical protein